MIFTPKPFYSRAQCHTERMPRRGTVCANLATQQLPLLPLSTSWISSTTFLDQLSTPSSPYYASIFLSMYLSNNQYQSIHPLDYNAASKRSPQLLSAQESIGILQPALLRCCGPGPGVMDGCTCQAPPAKLVGSNGIQFSTCPAVSNWCLWWATELVLQGMPAQVKHGETSFAEQLG